MAYDHGDHDADDSGAESNYVILCMGKLRGSLGDTLGASAWNILTLSLRTGPD